MVVSVPLQVQKAPQTLNILKIGSNCPAFPTPTPWQLLTTEKSPTTIGFTVDLNAWSPATKLFYGFLCQSLSSSSPESNGSLLFSP